MKPRVSDYGRRAARSAQALGAVRGGGSGRVRLLRRTDLARSGLGSRPLGRPAISSRQNIARLQPSDLEEAAAALAGVVTPRGA